MKASTPKDTSTPRYSRLRAWRNRWFWQRMAKRLGEGRADCAHAACVYASLQALDDSGDCDALFALSRGLGQAPNVASTGTSIGTALRERLARELRSPAAASLLRMPDGAIGGYAWGRIGPAEQALAHLHLTDPLNHLRADDWQRLQTRLVAAIGSAPLLTIYAIGLGSPWRHGLAPLKQLLLPLFDLATASGARHALWWAPRGTPVHPLSIGFGADVIGEFDGAVFFLHPDVRSLARIFAHLPASAIADGLSHLLPARPPLPPPVRLVRTPVPDHE